MIVFALEWLSRRAHINLFLLQTQSIKRTQTVLLSTVTKDSSPVWMNEDISVSVVWACVCAWSRPVWGPIPTPTEHQLCEQWLWWAQVYSHRWPQPAGQWALLLSQFIMCSRCPPWLQPWHHTNSPFTTWWHTAHTLAHWWHLEETRRAVHVRIKSMFSVLCRGCI